MDTIAAIATPSGRGGVGIIRISGPQACEIAQQLMQETDPIAPRRVRLGTFYDADGVVLDSGIVLYFPAPASYTGEDVVELQAHGSPVLLQALLDRVLSLNATMAQPGEFTRRAVQNGKLHLEQAEAVAACIDAATLRAAKQAQRHLQGEFGQRIDALMQSLTGLLAHVEACLDFPEEEIPSLLFDQLRARLATELLQPIDAALATSDFGERLFGGATVAITGAPNVGKSTLLNRLAGRERAIVSAIPGTTRDILEVDFDVHGIPVRLLDTAGMRSSEDIVEQEGIRRAQAAAEAADVTIAMADALDSDTWHMAHPADLYVMNKCDAAGQQGFPEHFLGMSAQTGKGVEALLDRVAQLLGDIPSGEEGLLVTSRRHRQLLERSREHLVRGQALLGDAMQLDLLALEWRQAWSSMGEILGIGDDEHLLDTVFSQFCIGK